MPAKALGIAMTDFSNSANRADQRAPADFVWVAFVAMYPAGCVTCGAVFFEKSQKRLAAPGALDKDGWTVSNGLTNGRRGMPVDNSQSNA